MRLAPFPALARVLLAALGIGAPILGVVLASCGTDAVGVDACRQIETARCEAIPVCKADFDVEKCTRFYGDECLVGIENDAGPSDSQIADCVGAVKALADCVKKGVALEACTGAPVAPPKTIAASNCNGGEVPTSCALLQNCPELLAACAFVAGPPATITPEAGTDADAGDMDAADDDGG